MVVFVYGTLKKNNSNNFLMKQLRAEFIENIITKQDLCLKFALGLPVLIKEKFSKISGELWKVSVKGLERIDTLEGAPRLYKRELIIVKNTDGQEKIAWAYFFNNKYLNFHEYRIITTGNYIIHPETGQPMNTISNKELQITKIDIGGNHAEN